MNCTRKDKDLTQGYPYGISIFNLGDKGKVNKKFCDPQTFDLPPSLFTYAQYVSMNIIILTS